MMKLNTDPPTPQEAKPACIRDMHELVRDHLPCAVVKLTPLEELERRGAEIQAEHPRFREEVPIVVATERFRRAQHQHLQVLGSRTPAPLTGSQTYFHA